MRVVSARVSCAEAFGAGRSERYRLSTKYPVGSVDVAPDCAAACVPPWAAPPATPAATWAALPITDAAAEVRNAAAITEATAQLRKPLAVSRKNTSGVCRPAHLVRRRPVRYPPTPAASHWVTTNHTAVAAVTVVSDMPVVDHGETLARPKPEPSAIITSDRLAAANAPPRTAPQDTPERGASGTAASYAPAWGVTGTVSMAAPRWFSATTAAG